ncbi:tape measure protein [Psychrobacter pacificensis]|uniref:tape measure protein n=1 Tax=Psychrobacter pacificensis TaxID=112002 RepID=UPI001CBCC508|nr:tape measure protein [Psychrobacter pacificensis]MBZ1392843.1 tape measure protein [Psychrobacter pacificensis]
MANRLDTELLITAGVDGLQHIDKLIAKIEEAGGDTEQLRDAARRLNSEWDDLSAEEQASRLRDLGNAANNSAGDLGLLRRRTDEANNSADRLGQGVDSVKGALNGLKGLIATLGISVGATELLEMADSYKTLEAKIKLATGEGVNFINGFGGVQEIANETFTSIEDTGELFARISRAGKEMNLAQQDVLSVTKTINEAIQLSGGSAESNQAAITQLIQGLQSGVVRGEEFNSIMEQSPRLARAMADGLGVTLGQLRSMAAEGKLTSDVVINAVQSQGEAIQSEFDAMPLTIGQSLTQLKNNFLSFVGDIDKQLNSSGGVSSIIQQMAESLDDIDPATTDAVREAFTQLGEVAQLLGENVFTVTDNLGEVWNAFDGTTAAGEKVGLLTKIVQELSIFIGHIADGVKGLQIASDLAWGGMLKGISLLLEAYAKLTGGSTDAADAMMAKGDEMVARAKKNALEFESSAVAAADNAAKTHQQRLDETAVKSRQAYEQMAADGTASAGKIQEAYVRAALDAIKANGDVVDARLEAELAEQGLQAEISETGRVTIVAIAEQSRAMQDAAGISEELSREIDKASASFKTLGLDAEYFATGMDSKVTASLSAFSEVAQIAGDDTAMLARAYGAASEKIGTNVQAQAMLQQQLLASTNGNSQLADEVKRVAIEQKNAKSAADDQAAALSRLGISMDAVNQSMSASGLEMVTTLRNGITAIKEQATSADALKTALTQALDTSIAAAKTKADFEAISQTLKAAGVSGQVTAEQMKLLQVGMQGGADAVDAQTKALNNNALANTYNTNATADNANAKKEQADAADKAAAAVAKSTQNESASLAVMQQITGTIKAKISALEQMGATTEQVDGVWRSLTDSMNGMKFLGIADFASNMRRVDDAVSKQITSFENAKNRAEEMTQALSGSAVTSRDLTDAQHALRQATDANIKGLIRMDQSTLNNLQNAIDETKKKMEDLADNARETAEQLEGELAKLRGDDSRALEIEQARELKEIEDLLADARKRGNPEEIKHYSEALKLQKEINQEKRKQARDREREERQREQQAASRNSSSNSSISNRSNSNNSNTQSATDVADAWDARIEAAKKQAADEAVAKFAQQLKDEAKRRT